MSTASAQRARIRSGVEHRRRGEPLGSQASPGVQAPGRAVVAGTAENRILAPVFIRVHAKDRFVALLDDQGLNEIQVFERTGPLAVEVPMGRKAGLDIPRPGEHHQPIDAVVLG